MQINVAQLLKQATGASRSHKIDDTLNFIEQGIEEFRVQGEMELIRTGRGVLVRGTFTGKSRLMCSRCLTLFDYPLISKIEEEFLPSIDVTSGVTLSVSDDLTVFTIDEYHILDLSEAVRQYSLLAMPMKPLCHPRCAGLCPQCGANLNQGTCYCPTHSLESPQGK